MRSELQAHGSSAWSGLTYQKPFAPVSMHANPFSNIDLDQTEAAWSTYRQPGDSNLEPGENNNGDRQSFATLTAYELAKLYRIIHECILIYCGSRGKVSANSLLDIFRRYLMWKDGLARDLQNVEGQPLPHVLFLQ